MDRLLSKRVRLRYLPCMNRTVDEGQLKGWCVV